MLTRLNMFLFLLVLFAGTAFAAEQPATPASPAAAPVSPPTPAAAGKTVTFETTDGKIKIELFDDKAPVTVANFRKYVKDGFYNGLIFHRVIPGFVIQGGGFTPGMKVRSPSQPSIKNEADNGLKNLRGTLSMARTSDINSATSQFFVNLKDNADLDHHGAANFGYAVFGKVVEGMDVVDKIAATPTGMSGGFRDVPTTDMVIMKAYEN